MERSTITRTAVLFILGSASLTWFALVAVLNAGGLSSGGGWLVRVSLAAVAAVAAAVLFQLALELCRSAEEARARSKAIPAPIRVQARRMRVRRGRS